MDFTREPIIETVITPKEGCKLVVRSSKNVGQEEYFVDSLEVVSFGNSFFLRSTERPKAFLVPASDYEILEVREARMVLKNVGMDRSIKIAGGRDGHKPQKESIPEKADLQPEEETQVAAEASTDAKGDANGKVDKKRDRRRHYRRRRGREDGSKEEGTEELAEGEGTDENYKVELPAPVHNGEEGLAAVLGSVPNVIPSLLPPPPTLISETIARYKDNALFRGAFYTKEEVVKEEASAENGTVSANNTVPLAPPEYGSFEMSEEEEEEVYRQRRQHFSHSREEGREDTRSRGEEEQDPFAVTHEDEVPAAASLDSSEHPEEQTAQQDQSHSEDDSNASQQDHEDKVSNGNNSQP